MKAIHESQPYRAKPSDHASGDGGSFPIDIAQLLENVDGDRDIVNSVIRETFDAIGQYRVDIFRAAGSEVGEGLKALIHDYKGIASMFNPDYGHTPEAIERLIADRRLEEVPSRLPGLDEEMAGLRARLQPMLEEEECGS